MERLTGVRVAVIWASMLVLFLGTGVAAMPAGMELGIKGGFNSANCSDFETLFDPEDWGEYLPKAEKGSKTGAVFGAFLSYPLTEKISLQPEFLYSQAGCKRDFDIEIEEEDVTGTVATTASVNYLEIPVLLNYALMGNQVSSPFICGGLSLGLKSSADYEMDVHIDSYEGPWDSTFTYDVGDYVKGTNFSLVIGGGYALRQPQFSLLVEARYTMGLANIVEKTGKVKVEDGEDPEYIYLDEAKPRTLSVMVGLALR